MRLHLMYLVYILVKVTTILDHGDISSWGRKLYYIIHCDGDSDNHRVLIQRRRILFTFMYYFSEDKFKKSPLQCIICHLHSSENLVRHLFNYNSVKISDIHGFTGRIRKDLPAHHSFFITIF